MKKLGLIGGTGPASTLLYYEGIAYGVQRKNGENFFPNFTVESLSVFEVLKMCSERKFDELVKYLLNGIDSLHAAGAQFGAISANTPHIVFDELAARSPIPLISIVEATLKQSQREKLSKIGLLGTYTTMKESFFKTPFLKNGIEIFTPNEDEMKFIGEKIATELELNIVNKQTQNKFLTIIENMRKIYGIESVVLGCTELPFIFNGVNLGVGTLDTAQIHIDALVDEILS